MREYNPMSNPIREWAADPKAAAAGVADRGTAEPLTVDHVLRPGSVTKMLTATLVMQCVDEGLVGLDDPVVQHVPEFRLRDDGDAERVLVRHLLSHTSGIDA